jgi:tetratricopeptide (TPR) repeat protein
MLRDAIAQAVALSINVRVRSRPAEVAFELSRAHFSLASYYFYGMQPLGMVANTLRATNAAEHTDRTSERARCYAAMSVWLGIVGQLRLARSYAARAIKACDQAPDDPAVVHALCVAALFYISIGDFERVDDCCRLAQQEADPRNDHAWWCAAQALSTWSLVYRGRSEGIATAVEQLRARAKRADSEQLAAWATRFEAHMLLSQGRAGDAARMFREVLTIVKRHGDRAEELLVQGSLVLALVRTGQTHEARSLLNDTAQLLEELMRPTSHIVLTGLSDMMEAIDGLLEGSPGDVELASQRVNVLQALDNYQRSFPVGLPRAQHYVGRDALRRGQRSEAQAAFRRGLKAAEQLGLPGEIALLTADLRSFDGSAPRA